MADIKPKVGNTPPQRGDLKKDELGVDIKNANLYIGLRDGNPLLIGGGTWQNAQPITAEDVDGIPPGTVIDPGLSAITILEKILYPEYGGALSNLNTTLPPAVELGVTLGGGPATITWSIPGNTEFWIRDSLTISRSGLSTGTLLTNGDPLTLSAAVTYPTFRSTSLNNNSLTISLQAVQNTNGILTPSSISRSTKWWSKVFWGRSSNENLIDVSGLNNQLLESTSASPQSLTITSSGGETGKFYIFLHDDYEFTSITYGGFTWAREPSIPVINLTRNGLTIPYKRYKSSEASNASVNTLVALYKYNG